MKEQPRYNPLEESDFFEDGQSSRPIVPHTVAHGHAMVDELVYTGESNGELATSFPFKITPETLKRGQERFNIFCSPCHGRTGYGNGVVAQRGFKVSPASFHSERLRQAPAGHFFNVITNGLGAMYGYAYRVPPKDRWAIIAYIRALQLSQNATLADVPQGQRQKLLGMKK